MAPAEEGKGMIDRKTLLAPPFAADPPVKLNISAKTLGLVMAIFAGVSAFFGVLGLLGLLGLSAAAFAFGGILLLAVIGFAISVAGALMTAWGGYRMFKGDREGKALAIYGLVLGVIGNLVSALGGSGDLVGWLIGALIAFVIYYLVVISRFPGEPPLTAPATTPR